MPRMSYFNILATVFFLELSPSDAQSLRSKAPEPVKGTSRTMPSPPILIAPSDHATAVRINAAFTWRSSPGALSYHLQVSTDSTFATSLIDEPALTDTTQLVTGLSHKTIYYWRVNATNSDGTSAFSVAFSFRSHVTPGDFNGSGEIQSIYAAIILRHVVGISVLTGDALETADVSGDGTVSAYDAALVLQFAAGLLSVFPVDQ